jgi:L-serine dehydratase
MRFTAFDESGAKLNEEIYYSVGGGFIVREGDPVQDGSSRAPVRYAFQSAADLLELGQEHALPIWAIMLENEKCWHTEDEIRAYVRRIWDVMQACVQRGLATEGILPGGLHVRRRAPRWYRKLQEHGSTDPLAPMDWVNVFAIAVNEENAAGGRVVTAPTNGAAGVIPAVAHYYWKFVANHSEEGIFRYFLTAAAIGVLYKENASISGAEVGCQGEVGVACSMAAAGLVAALDGTNEDVEHAAEIGMEHNLGMTCDPIGGLVQIPCIERNAIGAVKAINACRMSMSESGEHKVTSLAGLAVNVVEC